MVIKLGECYINPADISALIPMGEGARTSIYLKGNTNCFNIPMSPEEIINEIRTAIGLPISKRLLTNDISEYLEEIAQYLKGLLNHVTSECIAIRQG